MIIIDHLSSSKASFIEVKRDEISEVNTGREEKDQKQLIAMLIVIKRLRKLRYIEISR